MYYKVPHTLKNAFIVNFLQVEKGYEQGEISIDVIILHPDSNTFEDEKYYIRKGEGQRVILEITFVPHNLQGTFLQLILMHLQTQGPWQLRVQVCY